MSLTHEHQRRVVVAASRIDISDVSARLLFPTQEQGPWLPFRRFAETIATSRKKAGPHPHVHELVGVFVLEGNVEHEDAKKERLALAAGDVLTLKAVQPSEHQLMIGKGRTARWVSVVVGLPESISAPAPKVAHLGPTRPPPRPDGTIQTELIGGEAGLREETGLTWTDIEFDEEGTTFVPVGSERRGVAYVVGGPGSIENRPMEVGEGVLLEGVAGVALSGSPGFRVLLASAPCLETSH